MSTEIHRIDQPLTLLDIQREYRSLKNQPAQGPTVAIAANFSTQLLVRGLGVVFSRRNLSVRTHEVGFDQWETELTDPRSELSRIKPDIIVLMLSSLPLAFSGGTGDEVADRIGRAIRAYQERVATNILFFLPEPLSEEIDPTSWARAWRSQLVVALEKQVGTRSVLIDLEPLIREIGMSAWYAESHWITSKLPFDPSVTGAVANYVADRVEEYLRPVTRLVVVDLDNTLWGGVVGEDGYSGLALDPTGTGFSYLRLQRYLLGLKARGILLAICSKNNPADVQAVFENRPEMQLKLSDFSAVRINWNDKGQNISDILSELNLTTSGIVFLDDSPVERAVVRARFPEICVPEVPADVTQVVPYLSRVVRLSRAPVTAEDKLRTAWYSVEHEREKEKDAAESLDQFYEKLGLRLSVEGLTDTNLDRVVTLLGKTNQFNLTTRRYGKRELVEFAAASKSVVRTYSLRDRYGDYGLIGVAMGYPEGEELRIHVLLMSCRAMGRTVEHAMMRDLGELSDRLGYKRIVGEYIATPKNAAVANFYPSMGFAKISDGGEAVLYAAAPPVLANLRSYVSVGESE